jgi:hypothetical protein
MSRRLAIASTFAAALAAGALITIPTASARDVAWNVSIGAPGFAISAGRPYWGGYRPYYRPYYRAYAPVVYPAPVVYADPYYPYAYPARVVVRAPVYYGARRAYYRY